MDAAQARLIELLQTLAQQLAAGEPLARCLRQLPRADARALCAPLEGSPAWRLPRARGARTAEEAWLLARLALAAGGATPDRLAAGLAELACDLAARP
jgi:thiazole synthase ThiGH ThiG subunit